MISAANLKHRFEIIGYHDDGKTESIDTAECRDSAIDQAAHYILPLKKFARVTVCDLEALKGSPDEYEVLPDGRYKIIGYQS